jgi:dienelactone hydrolase
VLKAVLSGLIRLPNEPGFAAAVAYYPGCETRDLPGAPLETDTLILIGDADDWTPAERCARWRNSVQTNGHLLQMKTPALGTALMHLCRRTFIAGHYVGQDPAALTDAPIETRRFFDERLMSKR